MLLLLLACTPETTPLPRWEIPAGATYALHDPATSLDVWPDDAHTVPDPTTATGLRVRLRPGARAATQADVGDTILIADALEELDGFGTSGAVILRFSAPVDPESFADATRWISLADGASVPYTAAWTDDGATAILEPWFVLEERSRYAVLVDDGLRDLGGEPVWPSPWVHALVEPPQRAAWTAAAAVAGLPLDRIVAGTVYTTQSLYAEDDAAAALLRTELPEWGAGSCDQGVPRRCELTLRVTDLLGEDNRLNPGEALAAVRRYELPVSVWLPAGPGPFPVVLHGHGLSGDRGEAHTPARQLHDLGFAVVAIDAPMHGDHPTATTDADILWVLQLFGIDPSSGTFDPRQLRDQLRRAAWDKLQLAAAVRLDPDVDGDGAPDLDGDFIAWTGHSLGGLLGPQLLALDPDVRGAVLSVPGGRMSGIVHRSQTFAPLIALMAPPGTSQDMVDRFFPVLQAAIERGDPATWAGRLLPAGQDVLVTQVLDDTIIPNASTRHLARALGVEHAGPLLQPVDGLEIADGAPIRANVGGATGALWQYDTVHHDGVLGDAEHSSVFDADEHTAQLRAFLVALREGRGEVIDPETP